jgi:nucleotide-binding universal stress UspA family protein
MRILCALDGSPCADQGLERALELARSTGAELLLVYVADFHAAMRLGTHYGEALGELRREGEEILGRARDKAAARGVEARALLLTGRAAPLIMEAAREEKADLVVLGSTGRGRVGRFLGSVSLQVARESPVDVLIVRCRP